MRNKIQSRVMSLFHRTRNSLRHQGLAETVFKLYVLIIDRLFDIRYGLDTCAWARLSELTIRTVSKERDSIYQPARLVPLIKLFNLIRSIIPPDSVLVDFGCGKGRVLLAALEFGFKEVRGVEFAHELCEIAEKNHAVYKAKTGFSTGYRIIECDVANYAINADENVFFMFNPFNDRVLKKVLCNIAASLEAKPRQILIIYCNPRCASVIDQRADFTRFREFIWWGYEFIVYSNRD